MTSRSKSKAPTPDVTILGAGIIGVCTALAALENGLTVAVIDKDAPGEATSYGNAGIISPWSCVPQCTPGIWKNIPGWLLASNGPVKFRWRDLGSTIPWALRFFSNATVESVEQIADAMDLLMRGNIQTYQRYLAGTGREELLAESWAITVYRGNSRPSHDEWQWRLRRDRGAPIEFIDADRLREIEPALASDYKAAVILKDQARATDPGSLCKVLAEKAARLGARFHQARITNIAVTDSGIVSLETAQGPVEVNKLVVAAGAWSARLLKPLGYHFPLMAERGYHLEFQEPGIKLNHAIQDAGAKVYLSSMANGLRIAGTAEFAHLDAPPNYARARSLAEIARRAVPGVKLTPATEWMGVRPSLPDNLPAIGPLSQHRNIIAAFGHSHWGLGMAPATARLATDILQGRTQNTGLATMISPARWMK